jgi:serine/threonine protein kinase/tetratricopeptide (TPR) repeat protein
MAFPSLVTTMGRALARLSSVSGAAATRRAPGDAVVPGIPGLPELSSRFQLMTQLGRGGMGTVYRVYDRELGHEVALKILHGFSSENRLLLKREFRAIANIVHPNLVNLYDLVIDDHACFFTMEFVQGVDLVQYLEHGAHREESDDAAYERVRDTARQLALAIHALHEAGKLHRDIKPSNILVTEAGRVVLLDFGLSSSTTTAEPRGQAGELAGTLSYMAPEQFRGATPGPATDWYAFGVTLYEAICGYLPFAPEALLRSQGSKPVPLRERVPRIPEEIDALVTQLLEVAPERRPSADAILECLGSGSQEPSLTFVASSDRGQTLVGRDKDLEHLHDAFLGATHGTMRIVHVFGASGIGKSSLVRRFLSSTGQDDDVLVLQSRCHPQEAVIFNAIDGLIDQLAREIEQRLEAEARVLTFSQHEALLRVFPVLGQTLTFSSGASELSVPDGQELRRRAFLALGEVFRRLAERWRLVIWIDDLQWGDQESGVLLRDLLRSSKQPPLLLILTYREEDRESSPCLRILQQDQGESPSDSAHSWLRLTPLREADSLQLLGDMLGSQPRADESSSLAALIRDTGGLPFLLTELGRYLKLRKLSAGFDAGLTLEEVLETRTRELPSELRNLLEVFAVAGGPLERQVALNAAGLPRTQHRLITNLERISLLRTTDRARRSSEVYHDRIREQLVRGLTSNSRTKHHGAIARAMLATTAPNPLAALDHFAAAGDMDSVRRYVIAAANQAASALAFEKAAQLYGRAIELQPGELPIHEIHRRLAIALANAGRGRDAGQAFLDATRTLEGSGTHEEYSIHLRQRAAEQFLQTGHYEEGLGVLHALLAELKVGFPRSRSEALRRAAALRLRALLRGDRLQPRALAAPAREAIQRFDVLWATALRLNLVDYALTSYAAARCARDSAELGEPSRMALALSLEGAFCATLPMSAFQKRARKLIRAGAHLGGERPKPYDGAFLRSMTGVVDFYSGDYRGTLDNMDAATRMLRQASRSFHWEYTSWQHFAILALAMLGDVRQLVERVKLAARDAEQRDDRFLAQVACTSPATIAWLALDMPEHALRQSNRALDWAPGGYTVQHYHHFITTVEVALYRSNPVAAWNESTRTWPAHKASFFLMLTFLRDALLMTRAKAALAMLAREQGRGDLRVGAGPTRASLNALVASTARALERHQLPCGTGWALLLKAALDRLGGRRHAAMEHLSRSIRAFEHAQMALYREAARYCLGRLRADAHGAALMREAEAWMRDQGVVNPLRMTGMLAPALLDET